MSLINTEVQPFKANAFKNGEFITVTEADLKGKWSVMIFMPAAFTFNCPTEIEDAADHYAEFEKAGAQVFVVTTDTHFSHKVWHETSPAVGKAKFALVGDPVSYTHLGVYKRQTWMRLAAEPDAGAPSSRAAKVAAALQEHGALFFDELIDESRLLQTELEDALGELVARGIASCDSFAGLRALLLPQGKRPKASSRLRRGRVSGIHDAGRWSLLRRPVPDLSLIHI